MRMLPKILAALVICFVSMASSAQFSTAQSQFPLPAPAIPQQIQGPELSKAYSTWAIGNNQNLNSYVRIGAFKVRGTPYLFGAFFKADVYAKDSRGADAQVVFDTYHQQLEIITPGAKQSFVKTAAEIDSFVLRADTTNLVGEDMLFVSSRLIDPSASNLFLHQVYAGKRFNLYKSYKSDLAIVSDNYVQADLRQFDLGVIYYYTDTQGKGLKKIKLTARAIANEFSKIAGKVDVSPEGLNNNPQLELQLLFSKLNQI